MKQYMTMALGVRHLILALYGLIGSSCQSLDAPILYPCPDPCTCIKNSSDIIATCQDGDMAATVRKLPAETHSLKYILSGTFNETNVTFAHLTQLHTLELTSVDTTVYDTPSAISRPDLFEGLNNLRNLRLHVALYDINNGSLAHLTQLQELDLSYTRYLQKERLADILKALRLLRLPIKRLGLRNFQHPRPQGHEQIIDMRQDILQYLAGVPIEALDVGLNGVVVFNPGFTEFLPTLQVSR